MRRSGKKTFEVRKNDRDFKVGDVLLNSESEAILREIDRKLGILVGKSERRGASIRAGIAASQAQGRPFGRKPIDQDTVDLIRTLRESGLAMGAIAKEIGLGVGTVWKTLQSPTSHPPSRDALP